MGLPGRHGEPDARQRLYDLTRLVSDWIWETDPDGRFSYISGRVLDVLGLLPEEVLNRPFASLCDDPAVATRLAGRGAFRDVPAVFRTRRDQARHMLVSALPFYDLDSGDFAGMRGTCRDVTEQVQAEAALKAQLEFQQALLDAIPAPVFYRRGDGRYGLVNSAFAAMLGRTREAIVGRTLFDLFPLETARRLLAAEAELTAGGGGARSVMDRLPWPEAEPRDVILTLATTRDAGAAAGPEPDPAEGQGLIGVVTDITDRMRAERDLQASVRALERSNRELELFLHIASHDLQEPTRSVVSFCQLLAKSLEGSLSDEQQDYMNHAMDGARRMRLVVQDLGTYARAGSREAVPARVDMAALVAEVLRSLKPQMADCAAAVTVGALPVVQADRGQVAELVRNLIDNALKFCAEDRPPAIGIDAWRDDAASPFWTFRVSDNGIGIEARHHDRIFGLFQRLHRRDRYGGTGIGLAVCRKIVERHGGRIWVDSQPGKGTSVLFTLPALPSAAPSGGDSDGG
ncbi:sensor histidine kinase [Caenispirillum bisanense]|uniref:sensor histidine kinase n=1 Tax=Caenispirillum bisanense TaxID=414052 RepID=UPI0031D538C5